MEDATPGGLGSSEGLGPDVDRVAFEAWFGAPARGLDRMGDGYALSSANAAWNAWRAAWATSSHELRRWKSTHAPRLEALEGLLKATQLEAHAGREAVTTLASEKAANSRLTNEVDRLRGEREVLARWMAEALDALCDVDGDTEDGGESLRMLKDRGDRLVFAVLDGRA